MSEDELKQLIIAAIQVVAPEIEESDIDPDEDLREECDIDSMDFLNFLAELKNNSGVNIPEADYSQVTTLTKMLKYMAERLS
jgi:acyl carrier protein